MVTKQETLINVIEYLIHVGQHSRLAADEVGFFYNRLFASL